VSVKSSGKIFAYVWIFFWVALSTGFGFRHLDFHLPQTLGAPDFNHWFGFDAFGRDLGVTVLRASSRSLIFALMSVAISLALAIGLGSGLALIGTRAQFFFARVLDGFLAFPSLLFALALASIRGPGWDTLLIALLLGILPPFVRLVFARARELLVEDYVVAAIGMGAGKLTIIRNHLMPSLVSICRIKAPLLFAHALLAEATLSFLGIGAPMGNDTWGSLLAQSKDYLIEAPHIALVAGIPLVLTLLSLQKISES